jgi:hypothetical protein
MDALAAAFFRHSIPARRQDLPFMFEGMRRFASRECGLYERLLSSLGGREIALRPRPHV